MKKFIIMPEGNRWHEIESFTAESAFGIVCCWYSAKTRIAIVDKETKEIKIFKKNIDENGNWMPPTLII